MSKQQIFVLTYANLENHRTGVLGVFSDLEKSKTEAQRYNHNDILNWQEGCTDQPHQKYWNAPLTTWKTECLIEITTYGLDAKKFRIF
jgi:hypothetical protein